MNAHQLIACLIIITMILTILATTGLIQTIDKFSRDKKFPWGNFALFIISTCIIAGILGGYTIPPYNSTYFLGEGRYVLTKERL